MNATEVLTELTRLKITIAVKKGKLNVTPFNHEVIAPELIEQIKRNKKEIIALLAAECSKEPPTLSPANRDQHIPLSFAQQRLWFINQFEEGVDISYNLPWALRLTGKLNIAALKQTFQTIVDRHESLRTTFQVIEGEAVQVIADKLTLDFPVIEVTENEVSAHIDKNSAHVFDLTAGPLITAALLQLATEKHILLINMHHIISDGWSFGVLTREMTGLYGAYTKGRPSPLTPLPIQYADFSLWQRNWLQGEVLEHHVNYWKQQLNGTPSLLEMPTDYPRPAKQATYGAMEAFQIPKALSDQVILLGRKERVTTYMLLMTAFQVLLSRYSGQADICVGSPIANRKQSALTNLIGFFVNTIVIRTQVDFQLSSRTLLQQVKATALAAFRHQDLPFEQMIEALNPERSLSHTPVFQVMFALQNTGNETLMLDNITISPAKSELQTAQFDLNFLLSETDDGLVGAAIYNTDLFNSNTIERLVQSFQRILTGIVESPEQNIYQLPLLTESERQQLLVGWNNTKVAYPKVQNIAQLFETQAQEVPDATAVVYKHQQLTYQALNEHSNQLAHYLVKQAVSADTRVGICVERSLDMVIGILAILKAGGAYVPLDASYPKDRLAYMLSQANVSILLTQHTLCEQLPSHTHVINVDTDNQWRSDNNAANKNPVNQTQLEHLAYVLFTSGSTGKPKAVAMPHQALINLIQWQLENSIAREGTNTLQFSPISFDVSFQELFSTWNSGGTLVLITEDLRRDPFLLWRFIRETGINRLFMPFIALQQLAEARYSADNEDTPAALKEIITAGEQLQITPLICQLFEAIKDCKLYNHYGPSETHVVTSLELEGSPNTWESLPTIGTPIANNTIYILNPALQPVPTGVFGEMYIGGIGLADGYLGQDELTKKRFISNPFGEGRVYKTGDLARYRIDGHIEYKGRADDQIKIRGFRIELGEIENALTEQIGVQEAVVVAYNRSEESKDKYLAAFIVLEKKAETTQKMLNQAIKAVLPEYMVPSVFAFLDALPLTPSGKVDRRALPIPNTESLFAQKYVEPRTEEERGIANIWAEILTLPTDKVGIYDNFFDLGGHSLLTLKATIAIREKLNLHFSIKDFYSAGTISELMQLEEGSQNDEIVAISEADLDHDIKPCGKVNTHVSPKYILLTGCTGFIGRFLLRELIEKTNATIYCLVRANTDADAFIRLKTTMMDWELWCDSDEERVVAIQGNLELSKLGLPEDTYEFLSNKIDMIFHNATYMNHLATYNTLKIANIDGLKHIIRLASRKKQKLIQYVSTTGIFSSANSGGNSVDEHSSIDTQIHYQASGYVATKWVSEKLLMNAQAIGIPSNIFRLGLVSGDTHLGRSDSAQWFTRLLKICAELGGGFDDSGTQWLSIVPVDFVAQATIKLALKPDINKVFHIENPKKLCLVDIIKKYNDVSENKLSILLFKNFKILARKQFENNVSTDFLPLIHGRLHDDENPFHKETLFVIDSTDTIQLLKNIGINFPNIDSLLISKYFNYICQ